MKKFLLFIVLSAVMITGCSDDRSDRVSSFYEVGCSHSFGNFELGKNLSVSGIYPNEMVAELNCNSDVYVRIDFYDSSVPGHYRYFWVNNTSTTYEEYLYRYFGTSTGTFTFTTSDIIYNDGAYYAIYRVYVRNLETGKYTSQDFSIAAYDNGPYIKEPAISNFDARFAPVIEDADDNKSVEVNNDNNSLNNADNITK